jgi:hypothetical protein
VFDFIPPGVDFDFSRDLFPLLLGEGQPLFGYVADGYWCDVGNIDMYLKAQVDALSGKVKLNIPGEQITPNIWVGRSAKISSRADLKGPMVSGRKLRDSSWRKAARILRHRRQRYRGPQLFRCQIDRLQQLLSRRKLGRIRLHYLQERGAQR